jgi:2-polyprenyl-3-methyl-5-hydroxy-6-metoxy-1,4-benzoquinol methylase
MAVDRDEVACTSSYLSLHDDILICDPCGLARSVPTIETEELAALYGAVEDPDYLVSEEERRASFRDALEEIERYLPERKGSLLEIGSAVGLFLEEARDQGWEVTGIEPSRWASERARSRGLDVFTGTLESYQPNGNKTFDAVVLWDVLEHLPDPVAALRRIGRLVRPEGLVALTTVNIGGLGARLFRKRWPWLMRMHLHYFTPQSLRALVKREGFEPLHITTQPKVLKLGYVLERARGLFGPLATAGRWMAERLRLAERPVKVDLQDILLVVARKL